MKPNLTEQLAYCDAWLEKNKPVVWPSMKVTNECSASLGIPDVVQFTRGKYFPMDKDWGWAYDKAIHPGHWSVLEFEWQCYSVTGVSRICTHELCRHRHLSFMQESTRAIGGSGVIIIPRGIDDEEEDRYLELLATKSSILVAGNGRAWAEMLRKRLCLRAAPEIRYLAWLVASDLRGIAPLVYAVSVPDCDRCEEEGCSL